VQLIDSAHRHESVGSQHVEERQERRGAKRFEANASACGPTTRRILVSPDDPAGEIERIPEDGSDDLEHDGDACRKIERERCRLRWSTKCRIRHFESGASKAEISDSHGQYGGILLPQKGVDLDRYTSMRAEVVPRGHGPRFYSGEPSRRIAVVGVKRPFQGPTKKTRK
jgi:hypothetical protein